MSRTIYVDPTAEHSIQREVLYLAQEWRSAIRRGDEFTLGGATGRTHLALYRELFKLTEVESDLHPRDVRIFFLDEYLAVPLYWNYARQHLRVGQPEGFAAKNVSVPRGLFCDADDRLVDSDLLDAILSHTPGEWEPRTEPGEDDVPPEVHILPAAAHPVLTAIRDSNARYDQLVRTAGSQRLQLLGIGTHGHIGFVERGAAVESTSVMLVRLGPATQADNAADFQLVNGDGHEVQLVSSRYAITQGIGTILSAGQLLLAAHGRKKQAAVRRMLLDEAGPQNPAGFVTRHAQVRIFLDEAAFGDLDAADLQDRGFEVVVSHPVEQASSLAHDLPSALPSRQVRTSEDACAT